MAFHLPKIRDLSIRNKLIFLQFFTCLIVLALCCAAFVIADVREYKENKVNSLNSMAQLIASSSISALEFIDNEAANSILSDLVVVNDVLNAQILDKDNKVFASYSQKGVKEINFTPDGNPSVEFVEGYLYIYHEIQRDNGERIGMVCIRAELAQLDAVVKRKIQIAAILMGIGMLLAYLIALFLQKYISSPLLRLVSVMDKVSKEGSYGNHAHVEGKDEIGTLSLVFNEMLSQIERRDKELLENNYLLNSILNSMGDGVLVVDNDLNFMLWNPAFEKKHGGLLVAHPKVALGTNYKMFLPGETIPLSYYNSPFYKAVQGEEFNNQELLLKTGENVITYISITARPLRDRNNIVIGAVTVVRDITQRKQIQLDLDTARQQLQDMIDYSSACIFAKDLEGRYIFVNKNFEQVYKIEKERVIGNTDFDFLSREEALPLHEHDEEVFRVGRDVSFEEELLRGGNPQTFISIKYPLKDNEGKIYGLCGIATEISDRKAMEEADKMRVTQMIKFQETLLNLTSMEIDLPLDEKLKAILVKCAEVIDVERCGIWFFTKDKEEIYPKIIYRKSENDTVSGKPIKKSPNSIYFKALENFHTIDAHDALTDPRTAELAEIYFKPLGITSTLDVAIRLGGKISGMLCFEHIGDKRNWSYEVQVFSSSIAGIVALAIENFERLKAEKELHELNDELAHAKNAAEQSNAAKDVFLASMSHEIRTPLNAIIGFQQLLKETDLSDEQKEIVTSIDFAGRNLLVIINDILDLSKIEAGKVEFIESEINVAAIIRSVIELFEQKVKEKNLKIIFYHDPTIPTGLLGDGARLSQILLNLIGNAVKFTEKGEIKVITHLLDVKGDYFNCLFEVEDTGIGIPKDKLARIFERFTQAEADTTRRYGGTGLGLTISRHLIELQGGSLMVKSEPGKGSVFSFKLKFKKSIDSKGVGIAAPESGMKNLSQDIKPLKILLAEDTVLNQNLILKVFQKTAHSVDIANNGIEAVEKVKLNKYDIILMDVQMPLMDGCQATEEIRRLKDPVKSKIPIVALTAVVSKSEEERYRKKGMDAYITKPFDKENLLQTIYRLIDSYNIDSNSKAFMDTSSNLFSLSFLEETSEGDTEFIIKMVNLILEEAPDKLRSLKDAIQAKDYAAIKTNAHKLKNIIIPVQMERAKELTTAIEENSRNAGNMQIIVSHFAELNEIITSVLEPLRNRIEELKHSS
ncbi:PAS domain-containing protein [Sporocytophaga myxococcoides]|uniref:PAS domain-containing protein n=1 Tax=Sporocytophaga myxococcoides TaxID=153721 RepID=UPI00042A0179|nr:PAS domain-containing protein [Sporocytophaga myxococcoides]